MPDWTSSMQQTYEFYLVDTNSWKDETKINDIISCNITRDIESDTISSASYETSSIYNECYIRNYLITNQNGVKEKTCIGTFMVQTPSISYNGKRKSISMDAYSPLLELSDTKPDYGFTLKKGDKIFENLYNLISENVRCPVIKSTDVDDTLTENYTANADDSWLTYLTDLAAQIDYVILVNELGEIYFDKSISVTQMTPIYSFNDDNSSILYPDIEDSYDLYGIPNVVEIIYSDDDGTVYDIVSKNTKLDSPTSIPVRGREVLYRDSNPSFSGTPTKEYIQQYADQLLETKNNIQHTVTFSHGYYPVTVGDCVRINYERAGLTDIKAKITKQDIDCENGCKISTTVVYMENLWKEG